MNRRGFLKLLGIGLPVALIAQKVFAEPNNEIARTVEVGEPWYAPAGFTRGSLDRINQQQLLLKIKQSMERALESQIYEPNDRVTRAQIQAIVDGDLRYMQERRAIVDYSVVCNDANNPPYRVDQGFVNVDVYVKPVQSINTINLVATMDRSGVSFTEFNNEIARRFE